MTSCKSYCISKLIIFETISRWLTCDYSPRINTMSHLLPAVIWWPSSRCICRCLLIGGKLNSIKFRNQESFIQGNLQYMQFTKGYIQYRVIWSNIHLCGLEISIKASRCYHGNHQEKSMSNDEAPCKHSISCIYKNYQSLVISNLIKSFLSDI